MRFSWDWVCKKIIEHTVQGLNQSMMTLSGDNCKEKYSSIELEFSKCNINFLSVKDNCNCHT